MYVYIYIHIGLEEDSYAGIWGHPHTSPLHTEISGVNGVPNPIWARVFGARNREVITHIIPYEGRSMLIKPP